MNLQEIKIFRELFEDQYSYVALWQMSDNDLMNFLEQSYIMILPISRQLDLCYDYVLSQQIVDIQE